MKRQILLSLAALALGAATADAQVGYTPEQSPFRDLEYKQELTPILGWYKAQKDKLGIAPQPGALAGFRYSLHVGGPAYLTAEVGTVFTKRSVIDPARPRGTREITEESTRLYLADVGLAVALTGHRSWHQVVPELSAGLGLVGSSRRGLDVGGYQFGTPFAPSLGGGIRWVPGGRWLVRGDVKGRMYKITYPQSYFTKASDNTSVLAEGESRSGWTFNPAFTIGISYLLGR